MLMESYGLQQVDDIYKLHVQAWANQQAKATDKKGKSAYKKFDDFFDYEKTLDNYWGKASKKEKTYDNKLIELLRKANARGGT